MSLESISSKAALPGYCAKSIFFPNHRNAACVLEGPPPVSASPAHSPLMDAFGYKRGRGFFLDNFRWESVSKEESGTFVPFQSTSMTAGSLLGRISLCWDPFDLCRDLQGLYKRADNQRLGAVTDRAKWVTAAHLRKAGLCDIVLFVGCHGCKVRWHLERPQTCFFQPISSFGLRKVVTFLGFMWTSLLNSHSCSSSLPMSRGIPVAEYREFF